MTYLQSVKLTNANNFLWYFPFFEILGSKCAQQYIQNFPQRVLSFFDKIKKFFLLELSKKLPFFSFFYLKIFFRLLKRKTLYGGFFLDCCAHFETKISKNGGYHKKLFAFEAEKMKCIFIIQKKAFFKIPFIIVD